MEEEITENISEGAKEEESITSRINKKFGSDISILKDIDDYKKKLIQEKNKASKEISGERVAEKVKLAMLHFYEVAKEMSTFRAECSDMEESVKKFNSKANKVRETADNYIVKINDLGRCLEYLKIIEKIEKISDLIEAGINEKNEKKQESSYVMMKNVYKSLKATKCNHLIKFTEETLRYWQNILKDKIGNDFEDVLKAMKWPFVGDHVESVPSFETLEKFRLLIEHLLNIDLDFDDQVNIYRLYSKPISLPISLLIKPLRKRFMYHFMGSKQTNRADKPEWYFTQILTWIKLHQDFIEKYVQPVYDKAERTDELVKIEFMRGLAELAVEKLHYELPELQYDDSLFSHCIDEALGFEKELRKSYGYPEDKPGILSVLTQAPTFVKWINMERRYATEKLDKIVGSETAFKTFVSSEVDEYRITECAEAFMSLLTTITERYEMLPQPGHRLQFAQLQLELIRDFRIRLIQKQKEEIADPLDSLCPNILNTVHYLSHILEDLGTNTFFLQLHFYQSKLDGKSECEGTMFDECTESFNFMAKDLLNELVDHVFMDVKAKSMPYRKDRWHAMESIKDFLQHSVTTTACPMFHVLIKRLHQLQEILASNIFIEAWTTLAKKLDEYLYDEIVAIATFNEGGASQFNYDMTKNLFPLFGQYSANPEVHFKLLRDSCIVLTLPTEVALTLRDALTRSPKTDTNVDLEEILGELKIFSLPVQEISSLLSRRTDVSYHNSRTQLHDNDGDKKYKFFLD